MKAYLLYRDRDFDLKQELVWNEQDLTQDLELNTLFEAMAGKDKFLFEVARKVILSSLSNQIDTILYRQDILKDCLKNPTIIRAIYDLAVEAIERERKEYWGILTNYPDYILSRSVKVLEMFMKMLQELRSIADEHSGEFMSEGFTRFFAMLKSELDDEYFSLIQNHLKTLQFHNGVLISAELGRGNKGVNYILRKPNQLKQKFVERVFAKKPPTFSFTIADRDENGAKALAEIRDRGLNHVANALAQSTEHILSFFKMLQTELAFYIGCLNLHERLVQKGEPLCFPAPVAAGDRRHSFRGLYDISLSLTVEQRVVGNDLDAENKNLVIITGANQGGKSTFLRSVGLAQLMMQCGMFVPAESFCANVCDGLATHYKREEDVTMSSGKLDEELKRMSEIIDHITPNYMVLFNESFAATNEREGSEIARQVVSALIENNTKIFYVTHLYDFAQSFNHHRVKTVLFLRAERLADGTRTFKIIEGEPLSTSYGEDVYRTVFNKDGHLIVEPFNNEEIGSPR
jgi:DNA mismatch repair ATPase MutS